jgi:hypothetical protein
MRHKAPIPIRPTPIASLLILVGTLPVAVATTPAMQRPANQLPAQGQAEPRRAATRPKPPKYDSSTALDNEYWLAIIDDAMLTAESSQGSYLIAVAHLGKGETDSRLNSKRLAIVQRLLTSRGTPVRLVAASGERVPGLGRIELYVCNELYAVLPYLRNRASAPYDAEHPEMRPLGRGPRRNDGAERAVAPERALRRQSSTYNAVVRAR